MRRGRGDARLRGGAVVARVCNSLATAARTGARSARHLGLESCHVTSVSSSRPVPVARRVSGFTYAIRNIVAEAKKVEAAGRAVRYLNIGDPIPFGFETPAHLIEAVNRATREQKNGYTPSPGILSAREAVADDFTSRGFPVTPDRAILTSGTSEGIELTLGALVEADDEVLVPVPTYPLYTAVLARLGARPGLLPHRSGARLAARPRSRARVDHAADAGAGADRSEQPDGRRLSARDQARAARHRRGARPARSSPTRSTAISPTTGRWSRSASCGPTPRSLPTRRCRRPTSRPAGAAAGWRSAPRRAWTRRWRPSRSWRTAACAAPGRCNTRSRRRCAAIDRTRRRSTPRWRCARASRPTG